jgi:hypothetical protein
MKFKDEAAGGCACGAVRFVVQGPPRRVGLCHCLTCRKAHAAAFNPFIVFAARQVTVTGTLANWHSSADYDRRFCPECGSRVMGVNGDEIELSVGSFDQPDLFQPAYESWTVRREHWLRALDVPQHAGDRVAP